MASRENSKREMTIVSQNSAFYTPTEREIGKIHCFLLFRRPIRYIRRRTNGEREGKKKEEKREREIGENHWFTPSCPSVHRIRRGRNVERDRNWGKSLFSVFSVRRICRRQYEEREKLGKIIVPLLSVFPVHRITSKKIFHKV